MALLVVLLSRSWRAFSGSQELPLRLAAVVESYAENWELLAVEDPVQLNAALTQVCRISTLRLPLGAPQAPRPQISVSAPVVQRSKLACFHRFGCCWTESLRASFSSVRLRRFEA